MINIFQTLGQNDVGNMIFSENMFVTIILALQLGLERVVLLMFLLLVLDWYLDIFDM